MKILNERVASTACHLLGHKDMFELASEIMVKEFNKRGRAKASRQLQEAFELEAAKRVEDKSALGSKFLIESKQIS